MLGERVDADWAVDIGLANSVVERSGPGWRGRGDRPSAGRRAGARLTATKSLLARELDMGLSAAIELEAVTQALLMTSADHAEFYRAFTEGRDPRWSGR